MPYFDASPADLRGFFGLNEVAAPAGAVLVGTLTTSMYGQFVKSLFRHARSVHERITEVTLNGQRVWFIAVLGAAQAATFAHLAVRLGAGVLVQLGAMGGLQRGWNVGDVLVPTTVVGRDGVSQQLSRNLPLSVNEALSSSLIDCLGSDIVIRRGTLVTTTTIAFERRRDIARWSRAGFAGVEMEAAATLAVGQYFGVPATCAFVLHDNLAASRTAFDLTDADRDAMFRPKAPLARAAARVIVDVSGRLTAREARTEPEGGRPTSPVRRQRQERATAPEVGVDRRLGSRTDPSAEREDT